MAQVLAVGVVARSVHGQFEVGRGRDGRDLEHGGGSANPLHIGLEDVDEALFGDLGEGAVGVPALSRGQHLRRQAAADVGVAGPVVGLGIVLDPGQAVGAECLAEAHRVGRVEHRPAVEHDVGVGSQFRAGAGYQAFGLFDSGGGRGRADPAGQLERSEAPCAQVVEVVAGGVAAGAVPGGAADELVHRYAEDLALEVP